MDLFFFTVNNRETVVVSEVNNFVYIVITISYYNNAHGLVLWLSITCGFSREIAFFLITSTIFVRLNFSYSIMDYLVMAVFPRHWVLHLRYYCFRQICFIHDLTQCCINYV
jgi:hypothetical protein